MTLESGQGDGINMDLLGGVVLHPFGASEARQACSILPSHSLAYIIRNQKDGAGQSFPSQLVSWSAKDFKMESAKTARACYLAPPCDLSTEPVLNQQSLRL